MIAFQIEENYLELSDNTNFSFELENPLFSSDAIGGSLVYSFSVPNSAHNRRLLDFVNLLPVMPKAVEVSPVRLYLAGQLYQVGRLVIRDTSDESTQLSFHADAGSLASKINNLKLAELPLGSFDLSYDHQLNYPDRAYALPVLHSPEFYGDKNLDFKGYVNYYHQGNPTNTEKNYYTLCPMPYLLHVLKAMAVKIGYDLSGPWLDDPDTKRLIIYNNKALDQKNFRLNLFQKKFNLADHVPDITVGQMLVDLKNLFGLGIFVDPSLQIIHVRRLEDVINSSYYREMSRQAGKRYNKSFSSYSGYKLTMTPDSADNLFRDAEYDWLSYTLDAGRQEINSRASTLVVEEVQDTVNVARKWTVPKVSQKGNSAAFGVSGKNEAFRLLYYNGMQPDSLKIGFPSASYQTARRSLHWDGDKGLYNQGYRRWLDAMKQSIIVEREMLFSLNDLMTLNMSEKLMIEGLKFFIKNIRLGIKRSDTQLRPAKVKLVHTPF